MYLNVLSYLPDSSLAHHLCSYCMGWAPAQRKRGMLLGLYRDPGGKASAAESPVR